MDVPGEENVVVIQVGWIIFVIFFAFALGVIATWLTIAVANTIRKDRF